MDTQYLDFREAGDTGKTKIWDVMSKSGDYRLGTVKWYGPWRQYAFFPEPRTTWNADCLDAVTAFIKGRMREWRESKARTSVAER